jgi:hypothetical protein
MTTLPRYTYAIFSHRKSQFSYLFEGFGVEHFGKFSGHLVNLWTFGNPGVYVNAGLTGSMNFHHFA